MKVRSSLRSLRTKGTLVKRGKVIYVINKKNPRAKAKQG